MPVCLFSISSSVLYYRFRRKQEDTVIEQELSILSNRHHRWGFWMMHHYLRLNGHRWNHKRIYRIYTAMRLNLRRKHKRRLPARIKEPLLQPIYPNVTWSMDFMHDGLMNGKAFRCFNVIDDFNREVLNITLDTCLSSHRIIRELETLIDWRGKPINLRVDNGPEFIAHVMQLWCHKHDITLKFIQKGKPNQNGYIERFNRTYREEVLDSFAFDSLQQAQLYTHAWMWMYNNQRPHSALFYNTPNSFLLKYGKVSNPNNQTNDFPTFQQDTQNHFNSLFLNVAT